MKLYKPSVPGRGVIEHFLLLLLLVLSAGLFVQYDVLWRWDNLLYDAQLSFWTRSVSDEIIIVAIDDESLNKLGRWPWTRSTHARLIHQIQLESPRAIGLDIIFSEIDAGDSAADRLLSEAIQSSGKVVLPVYMSQLSANSYPMEALPLPVFTRHAAALGHVHIDLGDDGIARRVYLREGIGAPHWLHYSLAVLSITDAEPRVRDYMNNAQNVETSTAYSAMQWSREYPFLIPYAGPPGHFPQIGYAQVLSGNYPKDLFRDRIVLIGATAEGMGDALPTPLSGHGRSMPGVEIIANIIDAMLHDLHISELHKSWLIVITAILVSLPLLIYPLLNPASTLVVLFGIVAATLAVVGLLLWLFGVWLPVSTTLLFQVISYPLWSWRRLELAMRHINTELNQLTLRQKALSVRRERNISDEISFISLFIPVRGWLLQDEQGGVLIQQGDAPSPRQGPLKTDGWMQQDSHYWVTASYQNKPCYLGLSVGEGAVMAADQLRLLDSLVSLPLSAHSPQAGAYSDVLETKIAQVQAAGSEYEELRHIIDDSLSGMADGILICSSRGQVMLSNRRAGWYLYADDNAMINGQSLSHILQHIQLKDGASWSVLLQSVLFKQERVLTNARHESGRDLMVEISPMRIIGDVFDGFVVNFSDISLLKASERTRDEVLNFLSHDLRSPLSSMLAMIELTKNKSSIEEMRAMLTGMEKNTHKTLHLAEQFLQLSRANTNESLVFYDIDINSVVLNAIDQLWALSNQLKVTIHSEFTEDECWTHAEADLLERAIINLLSNAIKHSEAGSTVDVHVACDQHEISCCVIDRGSGISSEELPHLFEMFRRTRTTGGERKQGIGLGLAFVDAVAKRHSGYVDVDSEPGKGSTFCLRIPVHDPLSV